MRFPEMLSERPGTLGWVALGVGVVAFDVFSQETLSSAVDRALVRNRVATLAAIGLVAGHLANVLPDRYDPLARSLGLVRNLVNSSTASPEQPPA